MKRFLLSAIAVTICVVGINAQATLPSIMLRPGSSWCAQNGYVRIVNNQGQEVQVMDYTKAMNDPNMLQSTTEISALLKDEGFKVSVINNQTQAVNEFTAEESLMEDEDGGTIDKSALDVSRERARADVYLDLNWSVSQVGPKTQLSYTLQGFDAYSGEEICSVTGLGEPTISASQATLLREAVVGKMGQLKDRLGNYLSTMLARGRTVKVGIRVTSTSNVNLRTEMGEGELGRLIYKWLLKNAVEHRAAADASSSTSANYTVNIPLYDTDELPMNTEDFTYQLKSYLSTMGIKSTVENQGLGRALLKIQGKN